MKAIVLAVILGSALFTPRNSYADLGRNKSQPILNQPIIVPPQVVNPIDTIDHAMQEIARAFCRDDSTSYGFCGDGAESCNFSKCMIRLMCPGIETNFFCNFWIGWLEADLTAGRCSYCA